MAKGLGVDVLLKEACLRGHEALVDVAIHDGIIQHLGVGLEISATTSWQLEGRVVLPALKDMHVHLDKSYVPLRNDSGTLAEAIEVWRTNKASLDAQSYRQRALKAIQQAILNGTGSMRTHIDIDASHGFTALESILQLREEVKEILDLRVVALGRPGQNQAETKAMQTALELGADLVGAAPALSDNPKDCIDSVFALAERYDKAIDLHIDETENPAMRTLDMLAEATTTHGFQGRVTAGHCCSLDFMTDDEAARLIARVAEADIEVITLPSCNLVLMGRGRHPMPRGLTRVKELIEAGVRVLAASDNVHDPFNPFGHYDPLWIANLTAQAAHMSSPTEIACCLDMVSGHHRELKVGDTADLVIIESQDLDVIVTSLPTRHATLHGGRCIVKQEHRHDWQLSTPWM